MNKDHPLYSVLRMRKYNKEKVDMAFDLLISNAYFCGQFGNKIPVEDSREIFRKLVELIENK